MKLKQINEARQLMNFDYMHMYWLATRGSSQGTLLPLSEPIREISTDAEYGVQFEDNLWRFSSLERCQEEAAKLMGAKVLRLGRGSRARRWGQTNTETNQEIDRLRERFIAMDARKHSTLITLDESGAFEIPAGKTMREDNDVSEALQSAGFQRNSGCRPSPEVLLSIFQDQTLDLVHFAESVVKFCDGASSGNGSADDVWTPTPEHCSCDEDGFSPCPACQRATKKAMRLKRRNVVESEGTPQL